MADEDEREQRYDNGRATPDGVKVAAGFAAVLVSVVWVGIVVSLRGAGAVRMLDVFGDLLGPVVRRGQIIKWTAGGGWREREAMMLTP